MKKKFFLPIITVLIVFLLCFTACNSPNDNGNDDSKTVVRITADSPTGDYVIGENDFSNIPITVYYADGKSDTIFLSEKLIAEKDKYKLSIPGRYEFQIVYEGVTTQIFINLVRGTSVYYTLSVEGGYVSAVDGVNLVSPVIPEVGQPFTATYPAGTQLVLNWKKDANYNFDYWTVNGVKMQNLPNIFTVTLNSDMNYCAYSSAIGKTVSFQTGFDDLIVRSKTTELLNASNIEEIHKDGYVFLGWTTDEISFEQAISAYGRNRVKFPYSVTRNIVFYAVWTPIGIDYELQGDSYALKSFNGDVKSLVIPENYNDKPVTTILKSAFDTEKGKYITDITLTGNIETIEDGAFVPCKHLSKISVSEDCENFSSIDGILFGNDDRKLVAYPSAKVKAEYTLPDEVTEIAGYAFCGVSVAGIKLNSSLRKINNFAFYSSHIEYVDFYNVNPAILTISGDDVFHDYTNMVRVSRGKLDVFLGFPQISELEVKGKLTDENTPLTTLFEFETTEIGDNRSLSVYRMIRNPNFENSGASVELMFTTRTLEKFTLQIIIENYFVTSIAEEAFDGAYYLNSFILPLATKLERVCDNAFDDTYWASHLTNNTILSQDKNVLYKYLGNETVIHIDTDTKKIAEGAFSNNNSLQYIDITDNSSLQIIAAYAFYNCTSFKGFICTPNPDGDGIYLKNKIKNIGAYAFYNTSISRVVLQEETVSSQHQWRDIGEYAFSGCDKLFSVQLSKLIENIAKNAFLGCYALEEFVMLDSNNYFVVYDGILYSRNQGGDTFGLYCYPAGRMDGFFDPSVVKNYPTKEVTMDERIYLSSSGSSPVGSIYFNGIKYDLMMGVAGYSRTDLTQGKDDDKHLYYRGTLLSETTDYDQDYNPNGAKYFYVYLDKNSDKKTFLRYDPEEDTYFYIVDLTITAFMDYSLYYSNIAALFIPNDVILIEENAVKIPGLVFAEFEGDAIRSYSELFGEYEPDYVILKSDSSKRSQFYGDDSDLQLRKNRDDSSYVFFYGYDTEEEKFDYDVLYAYEETGSVKTSVVRTSRTADDIIIPADVYMYTTDGLVKVSDANAKKRIFPYSFYGGILKSVHLNMVSELRDNAFSGAYEMVSLEVNTDFINNVGENVFGEKLNNGLYIYDYTDNGIELYQSYNWGLHTFIYSDKNSVMKTASEYLIRSEEGAFAVIAYRQGNELITVDILYGNVPGGITDEIERMINERYNISGYYIKNWRQEDEQGNLIKLIDVDKDYFIPVNQILICDLVPKKYTVYLSTSRSVVFDYDISSSNESGMVTYVTEIDFGGEYSFIPVQNDGGKYIFICDNDDQFIPTEGIWDIACEGGEIYLRVVYGYKLNFDLNNEFAEEFEATEEYVFNGKNYSLGVPTSINSSVFAGWAYENEDGVEVVLTDNEGNSLSFWDKTDKNDYNVYALWE